MVRRTSISARLFFLVFGFSVAWTALTTGVQMVFEYRNTRAEVDRNLDDLFQATRAGLESALWNYDRNLLESSLNSVRTVRFLSGALVRDETGQSALSWGRVPDLAAARPGTDDHNVGVLGEPLYHRFPLRHEDAQGRVRVVGDLLLVSDFKILERRLADRLGLILINYLAGTLGLMVILAFALQRRVAEPLGRITRAIDAYRFDRTSLPPLERPLKRADELSVLWSSFEVLTSHLRESWLQQRVMSSILEEAAVMALVCDADGRVLSSNAQARVRLVGAQPGGDLRRLAYGEDSEPLFADPERLLDGTAAWRGEIEVRGEAGHNFWLATALLPLAVADDPRARWGVMIEDISARHLTEHYRRERDLAREATRAKSLFLANLSHEIRTPMNAVVGLTALALDEKVPPRAREYLSQLQRSGAALLGVINDILDYAKLEEGKVGLEVGDYRVAEAVAAVGAMTRFQAEGKGLEMSLVLDPSVPAVVRGDGQKVQQVLLNLVSNAVKFTDRGRIEVSLRALEAQDGPALLRWEVRDSGIGIAPADQARLFRSFSQVDPSATRLHGGTGLGLAICRQLVELMGGRIGVESVPGEGSLFWFELPLVAGQAPDEAPSAVFDLRGLRVLVAEDNKVNQLVAKEILAKVGVEAVVVGNGQLAVEQAATGAFDLVLMDLQMPLVDGLEATRRIRRTWTADRLPILALTAHTFAEERATCLEAGMQDLVPKPVDPAFLYGKLSRWRPEGTRT